MSSHCWQSGDADEAVTAVSIEPERLQELLSLDEDALRATFEDKFAPVHEKGWSPQLRQRFGYFSPDDYYETLMNRLVTPGCDWADIGCGHDVFPSNPSLADRLSKRAGFLLGIDPSPNVRRNPFISEGFEGLVEEYPGGRTFDIISLRMVAEHIADPESALAKIDQMTRPGGLTVIYTPFRWAPMSVLASIVPHNLHHPLKWWLWRTEPEDTFPVEYKLNTRADQRRHFGRIGFTQLLYRHLDDCRLLTRFKFANSIELTAWRCLRAVGLHYPETCLLSVHQKPYD